MEQEVKKKSLLQNKKFQYGVIIVFVFWIFGTIFSHTSTPVAEQTSNNVQNSTVKVETTSATTNQPQVSKTDAQKELNDLIALSKKAGLVTSYEFSDTASIVYAGDTWYTQTVSFKKDFLAKIGTLKKAITGYMNFEVRDAYSNEKLAEITAFSGSLEVYK